MPPATDTKLVALRKAFGRGSAVTTVVFVLAIATFLAFFPKPEEAGWTPGQLFLVVVGWNLVLPLAAGLAAGFVSYRRRVRRATPS